MYKPAVNYSFTFTIFTPTYNRCNTLPRLYESLKNQSYKDFEWLIIDDGSTDGTERLVKEWIEENLFPIRYYWQENHHKFHTILQGVNKANGKFFYTFDSDDVLKNYALQLLIDEWVSIPDSKRKYFSGITGLCEDQNGELIGQKFPISPFDSDSIESNFRYRIKGEKSGFHLTEVMKQFSFDNSYFKNGYIPESILWINIALKGYKTRYINKVLRIYYVNESAESISQGHHNVKNSFGIFLYTKLIMTLPKKYLLYQPKRFLFNYIKYWGYGLLLKYSLYSLFRMIPSFTDKLLALIFLPGALVYYYSKVRTR